MSFAKTVKKELSTLPANTEEMLAEFAGFLNLAVEFHIIDKQQTLDFSTNNPVIAKRFLQLAKALYPVEAMILTKENAKLNKKQLIIVRLISSVQEIINEHSFFESPISNQKLLTQTPECKKAFLRAAFLVSGSVNHPRKSEYHLEIYSTDAQQVVFIQQLMNFFDLNAKIIKRRNGYIAYLKEAQAISDMLQIIGATNAVFEFEDLRIKRDFNNSINRIINIEIANEKKIIEAANSHLDDIQIIEKYMLEHNVDDKLKRVIDLRKDYPQESLSALAELYEEKYDEKISKSGIHHRLDRINKMAEEIRKGRY